MNPNLIILSHPTYVGASGATAAATYSFISRGYKPPAEDRMIDFDIVNNQNGRFKYIYDNGPGFRRWSQFLVVCDESFQDLLGAAASVQLSNVREIWNYKGSFGMQAPEEVYSVHWAKDPLERSFIVFPVDPSGPIEQLVAITLEEA